MKEKTIISKQIFTSLILSLKR